MNNNINNIAVRKVKIYFIFSLIIIYLLAGFLRQQLFLSWDIGALLHATTKFLQGGNYVDDFFIPNPPMILYLYIPPVMLAQLLHISVTIIFPLYIFLIVTACFLICYKLIVRIFLPKDFIQCYLFAGVLAAVFLVLPIYEFGQRDHLLVVMAMPYLLMTVCRLQNQDINKLFALMVGLIAGLAIAIKPQFIVLPCLIEAYYLIRKKNMLAWLKPETLAIIAVQVIYLLFILITRQDFITVVMPYLVKSYYKTSFVTWFWFVLNDPLLFIYAAILFYLFLNKMNEYKSLAAILFIALLSFTLTYLSQGFTYYYHMVPALSLALLSLTQFYANIIDKQDLTRQDYKSLAMISVCFLLLQSFLFNVRFNYTFLDPAWFYIVFTVLYFTAIYLYQFTKKWYVAGIVVFGIAYASVGLFQITNFVPYFIEIIFTLGMLIIILRVLFADVINVTLKKVFIVLMGLLIVMMPSWMLINSYDFAVQYKRFTLDKLIAFMQTQPPHRSIYMFSSGIHFTFPMANYTNTNVVQRFDALWMIRGLLKQVVKNKRENVINEMKNNDSELFVLNMIVEDLRRRKPDLVFVEMPFKGQRGVDFDYLYYFLKNDEFRQVWQNYHYLTTINEPGVFKLDVYEYKNS